MVIQKNYGEHIGKKCRKIRRSCGVCCEFVTFHWFPGSGVVLDCIDFWSLHTYLLCAYEVPIHYIWDPQKLIRSWGEQMNLHKGWHSLHWVHPVNVPQIRRTAHLSSVIPANDARESCSDSKSYRYERGSDLRPIAPETITLTTELPRLGFDYTCVQTTRLDRPDKLF